VPSGKQAPVVAMSYGCAGGVGGVCCARSGRSRCGIEVRTRRDGTRRLEEELQQLEQQTTTEHECEENCDMLVGQFTDTPLLSDVVVVLLILLSQSLLAPPASAGPHLFAALAPLPGPFLLPFVDATRRRGHILIQTLLIGLFCGARFSTTGASGLPILRSCALAKRMLAWRCCGVCACSPR
jgi:hypothetical protein